MDIQKEEIQALIDKVRTANGNPDGKCCAVVSPNLNQNVLDVLNSIENLRVTTDTSSLFAYNERIYVMPDNKEDELKVCFE